MEITLVLTSLGSCSADGSGQSGGVINGKADSNN